MTDDKSPKLQCAGCVVHRTVLLEDCRRNEASFAVFPPRVQRHVPLEHDTSFLNGRCLATTAARPQDTQANRRAFLGHTKEACALNHHFLGVVVGGVNGRVLCARVHDFFGPWYAAAVRATFGARDYPGRIEIRT